VTERVRHLVVGAGISGLAMAAHLGDPSVLVLEADDEIGGYCKTIKREGFTWDYSGHFFHFRHPEIEAWLRARMPGQEIRTVRRRSFIQFADRLIDFPFQKNIHQLPREDFLACLVDLYFARSSDVPHENKPIESFRDMLVERYGAGIADRFLIPYNEKLYATDLATLDQDAMGRFFPHADLTDVIRNMRTRDDASYNTTFTYPEGGAIEYVKALASETPRDRVSLGESLVSVDLEARVAKTSHREIAYEHLISSMPLPALLEACSVPHDRARFDWNQVLVFNLGFDRKGSERPHWVYYPDREVSFYRVGYYDNIFDTDRMSLYVEVSRPRLATLGELEIKAIRDRVLDDLTHLGVVQDQRLVAEHHVVMNPAYVHVTRGSIAERDRVLSVLRGHHVHSIGRYGGFTYCSIEDNIVEARALAQRLRAASSA
jgi:protoporphyrinogen oxidase